GSSWLYQDRKDKRVRPMDRSNILTAKNNLMTAITSSIKDELYKVEITSPTGNVVIADEPLDKGGKDLGFSPKELLGSALAACTSATVKMYADRKEWDLQEVKIHIELDFIAE